MDMSTVKPGDVYEMTKPGNWIVKGNIVFLGTGTRFIIVKVSAGVATMAPEARPEAQSEVYASSFEYWFRRSLGQPFDAAATSDCKCSLQQLLSNGCICGHVKRYEEQSLFA